MGLKRCKNCNQMHPSAKRTCSCGYQFEIKSKRWPFTSPPSGGNYNELIMQQQHVLKQLTSQRPLSASACAAVANLIQVTSAAISANESQAGSSMLMDESEQTLESVGELESGPDGGFIKEENGVSHANDGSQSSQYGQVSYDKWTITTYHNGMGGGGLGKAQV